MKALQEFEIPFMGLKEGIHDYAFDIDAEFFENFEYSEVKQGQIHVDVSMERQERMLIFNFIIKGTVELPCDRCLAPIQLVVSGEERQIVKFGQEWEEESEDVLIMPETETRINISNFIYEYIMLMLPYKRVHGEDEESGASLCDESMVEKLGQYSKPETDPRWDALKELKNKLD
jgi:uncharacterized metal-binding protein YceD (DUF177 family)